MEELIASMSASAVSSSVRQRAADVLVRFVLDCAVAAPNMAEQELWGKIHLRVMEALRNSILALQQRERFTSMSGHVTDVEIHKTILDGLKSILENCGEQLLNGWHVTFQIIGSVFVQMKYCAGHEERKGSLASEPAPRTRSGKLTRSSFNSSSSSRRTSSQVFQTLAF